MDILYHYTSPEGLIGMISNNCIWATNIFYLNDSEEFMRGIDIARHKIQHLYDSLPTPEKKRLERLKKDLSNIGPSQHISTYVCSLTEMGDQLSQWRGYCRGGGFSVGFPKEGLKKVAIENDFDLYQCLYDEAEQEKTILQVIERFAIPWCREPEPFRQKNPSASETDVSCGISSKFIWELHKACSLIKNPSFAEEKEWRLISKTKSNWHTKELFRASKGLIVPYVKIEFPGPENREFWKHVRVVVGPSPYPEESRLSAKKLFRNNHGYEVAIHNTRSSFRDHA